MNTVFDEAYVLDSLLISRNLRNTDRVDGGKRQDRRR